MTWLTPLTGLIVAAAILPPLLLLYFLKLRRTSRSIPSTMLWRRSVEDVRANAPFQRLRPSILLFLQLLILLLLVLALAQPQFEGSSSAGGRTVIAIDNSGSMNATDDESGRSRLDLAKEAAVNRIEKLHGGGLFSGSTEEIMVVSFADGAEVRTPFTDSRTQAIAAVRSIDPTDQGTSIGKALKLARAFTISVDPESSGNAETMEDPAVFEVFSDGRISDLDDEPLRGGESASYTVLGSPDSSNVGIVTVAADRPWDRPTQIQVFTMVANHDPDPVEVDVELRVAGRARAVTPKPVTIPGAVEDPETGIWKPGMERVIFLPFEQPRGAQIEVRLLREDDLASDDFARLVVAPPKQLRVALVGEIAWFMEKLLEAQSYERLDLLTADQYEQAIESGESWDVVVCLGYSPEKLQPGRYLIFNSTRGIETLEPFGEAEKVFVRSSQDEHPAFRYVVLDDLFIWKMLKVVAGDDARVLSDAIEGPLVVEIDRAGVQVLWVAFHPLDSTWWRQRSFAIFVPNAIEYLASISGAVVEQGIEPGEVISMLVEPGASAGLVTLPDGTTSEASISPDGLLIWGPVQRAGVYEVVRTPPGGEPISVEVAVNMLDQDEGRIGSRESIEFSVNSVSGQRAVTTSRNALWPWLLGIGLLVLMLEWFVYFRKAA
ncbi:MAG: VWA domain-containing protein [Phycisphaerales bacterium]|nr:VWA domain-containing protein [Phycisphaerales bacterium]